MDAQVGKAVAGVGVVLALVAIWVHALVGQSYWDLDGTVGVFLLIMAILAALAVAAGASRAMLLLGGVLLGFYGFLPAAYATDHWGTLDAGAWLGFAGAALIVVAALALQAPSWFHAGTRVEASPLAAGIAALGLVLSIVAIWPDADKSGSYWSAAALGHSLGTVMLIAGIACGIGLAAGSAMGSRPGLGLAALAGTILCGLMLFVPIGDAFNQLGDLRAGGWLGFFGGLLVAGGTFALLGEQVSIGIAPVHQAPSPPPPSTA